MNFSLAGHPFSFSFFVLMWGPVDSILPFIELKQLQNCDIRYLINSNENPNLNEQSGQECTLSFSAIMNQCRKCEL